MSVTGDQSLSTVNHIHRGLSIYISGQVARAARKYSSNKSSSHHPSEQEIMTETKSTFVFCPHMHDQEAKNRQPSVINIVTYTDSLRTNGQLLLLLLLQNMGTQVKGTQVLSRYMRSRDGWTGQPS